MPSSLDLDRIKAALSQSELPIHASLIAADAHNMYGLDGDRAAAIAEVLNAAPALIAEVERLTQELATAKSSMTDEQHGFLTALANGKPLPENAGALWKAVEQLIANTKSIGAAGELERMATELSPEVHPFYKSWQVEDLLSQRAAEIRKGIK